MKIQWTDKLVTRLRELWQQRELSFREISEQLGIGPTSLWRKGMNLELGGRPQRPPRPPQPHDGTSKYNAYKINGPWTDEKVAQLKILCLQPLSYRQIAKELGMGRNATLAKAKRLGLSKPVYLPPRPPKPPKAPREPRPKRQQPTRLPRAICYAAQRPYPQGLVKPSILPPERNSPHRVPFLDAMPGQCRFPLWASDKKSGDVCGSPTLKGESYCAECAAIAGSGIWFKRVA